MHCPIRKEPHHAHHRMDLIRSRPDARDDTKEARRAHHRMDLIGRDPRPDQH